MKHLSVLKHLMLAVVLIFIISACNDSDTINQPAYENLNVALKSSEVYQYTTVSGDEESASILVQAKNFEISEIIRNAETNYTAVYKYKPKTDFTGTDYVELKIETGSDGASQPTKIQIIKINFVIGD